MPPNKSKYLEKFLNRAYSAMTKGSSGSLHEMIAEKESVVGQFAQKQILRFTQQAFQQTRRMPWGRSTMTLTDPAGTSSQFAYHQSFSAARNVGANRRRFYGTGISGFTNKSKSTRAEIGNAAQRYLGNLHGKRHMGVGMLAGGTAGFAAGYGDDKDPRLTRAASMAVAGSLAGGYLGRRTSKLHLAAMDDMVFGGSFTKQAMRRGSSRALNKKLTRT